jgi:SAM-dependent methyltransferase
MALNDSSSQTDRRYLTEVQYRTQHNLAARQSIYAYQWPRIDLARTVIAMAGLAGGETVADIGCGNGAYLAELVRRGHTGPVVGADLSPGMLAAARNAVLAAAGDRVPGVAVVRGDAAVLPLADGVADVTLVPHMLYHVPDRLAAVREFRRITRPTGQCLVVLNATDHLAELRELVGSAAADIGLAAGPVWVEVRSDGQGLSLESGAELLAQEFGTVGRHDLAGELMLPGPQPVLDYVASTRFAQSLDRPDDLVAAVARRLAGRAISIRTHCGVLVCR